MPIPRRFDRRPPERDQTRINERIRVPEVRLIGDDGNQIGVVSRDEALRYAQERDLDLVEVAAEARPPVCRVLDYSKYKYEQEQKAKSARHHQKQVTVREIKLRPKIAENDYETKKGHVVRFLKHDDKVKVTIMFRGREMTHPERGERAADAPGRGRRRARRDRAAPAAGRPQHDDDCWRRSSRKTAGRPTSSRRRGRTPAAGAAAAEPRAAAEAAAASAATLPRQQERQAKAEDGSSRRGRRAEPSPSRPRREADEPSAAERRRRRPAASDLALLN